MIDAYINLDNSHKGFNSQLKDVELNKVEIKNIINENQINLVITSLSKYGETKKNLSNFESSNNLYPTLIIVDDKDFEQAIDFIKNPHIELISSKSKLEELRARIHALVGDAKSDILEFKDL